MGILGNAGAPVEFFRVRKAFFQHREDDVRKTVRKKGIESGKRVFSLVLYTHLKGKKVFLVRRGKTSSHERLSRWKVLQYPRKRRWQNCLCFLTFLKTTSREGKVRS